MLSFLIAFHKVCNSANTLFFIIIAILQKICGNVNISGAYFWCAVSNFLFYVQFFFVFLKVKIFYCCFFLLAVKIIVNVKRKGFGYTGYKKGGNCNGKKRRKHLQTERRQMGGEVY